MPTMMPVVLLCVACGATMAAVDRPLQPGPGGADLGDGTFLNPILAGNWPDPSIVRDGADYYLVHSSNSTTRGLPVWHSRDLVNWESYGHALTSYAGDIWAPDIVKRGDTFCIYYCAGGSNFLITARDARGPWSVPVDLKVGGIDPALVTDGLRSWLFLDNGKVADLAADGVTILGKPHQAFAPWPIPRDWPIEGVCLEGPKIRQRDGWYHMLVAQGGTAGPPASHMVLAARSRTPEGPWEWAPHNPILRSSRGVDEAWWSMGHGSLIDTPAGDWWLVFHGYRNGYHTLGRATLLLPVEWTADGWPRIRADADVAKPLRKPAGERVAGVMDLSDDFSKPELGPGWRLSGRGVLAERVQTGAGALRLTGAGTSLNDTQPLLITAAHAGYRIETEVEPAAGVEAGLTLYYGKDACIGLGLQDGKLLIRWRERVWERIPVDARRLRLRLTNDRHTVGYEYAVPGGDWQRIPIWHEVSGFQHNVFGGFYSLRAGVFATGTGTAAFHGFRYVPLTP